MILKKCTKCLLPVALDEFPRRSKGRGGKDSVCRVCRRAADALLKRAVRRRAQAERIASRVNPFASKPKEVLAYLAGIIDGEGSIGIYKCRRTRGAKAESYVRPRISITNTSLELMKFVSGQLGGPSFRVKKKTGISKRTCYVWSVSNRVAAEVAAAVVPYLVVKRRQAELVLELHGMTERREGLALSGDSQAAREKLYQEAAALNGRGRGDEPGVGALPRA